MSTSDEANPTIEELIKQLEDDSFSRLEQASAALQAAGLEAYDALKAAVDSDDAESGPSTASQARNRSPGRGQ